MIIAFAGPSLSTLPANFSQQATVSQDFKAATSNRTVNTQVSLVSEKCRQCIHLDNTEPPPAKFQKVSRLFSRSILQTGDAVQQNVKEVQASGKQQMLCDEDTLLLSQYGYTGH
ncbi:hypothetical protein BaRGS_00024690 [Batillaria attramentaria]|uniref:Uncharacterized protein n=1 Tax=Batillaria attramentaria TaxID=370345 RepID=A0ABD0KAG3_9CAEN